MATLDQPSASAHDPRYLARAKKGETTVIPEVLLGAAIGACACLFAATVIIDTYEKAVEQRMLAEGVVQKFRQSAEAERFRISGQWAPGAAEARGAQ